MNRTVENITSATVTTPFTITISWCLVAIIALTLLAAYVFVFAIILVHPSDFKNSYYTLVKALAIADFYSLCFVAYRAIFGKRYYGTLVDTVFVFLYQSLGWHNGLHLNFCIGFNRFFAIAFFTTYNQKFTVLKSWFLALACLVLAVAMTACQYYVPSNIFSTTDVITGNIVISITILCCMISTITSVKIVRSCGEARKVSYAREMKMLFQGTVVSSILFVVEILYWFPVNDFILKIAVLSATGLNPIIYVVLDRALRKRCFSVLKLDKAVAMMKNKFNTTKVVAISRSGLTTK